MKIAVTYDNGNVFQHFGHTEKFKIYSVEDNVITDERVVDAMGKGHGALADFLKDMEVTALICGGIGEGAKNALDQAGIKLFGGVFGNVDEAVKALVDGVLVYNSDVGCSHHSHEEHSCGNNGCHR